ncbi:DUF1524 domain-containing protein [Rothia terrae]|uniref:GmrSD restriction endonuclease domain-containing protein n=1 Tax=Rothia terrae TaxID=396015 RepID=UPI00380CCA1E
MNRGLLGCLGCLGLVVVLFVGSAVIAGIVSAFSGGDSSKPVSTTSSSSASSTPSPSSAPASTSASPTPVETADVSGEAYDSADASAVATEQPNSADNAVASVDSSTTDAPGAQAALDKLNTLEVKGRAPKTGYDRDQFGPAWADVDHNGCDTRNDILRRDLQNVMAKAGTRGCKIASGTLNDPYTAKTINFVRGQGTSDDVQIDHVVALSDAWQKGAQNISAEQREQLANDPSNLLAVDGPTNQSKSDGDAATWLPPNTSYRCDYVSKQVDVKAKYGLWVTEAEKKAMSDVLTAPGCGARLAQATTEAPAPVQEEPTQAAEPTEEQAAPVEQAPAPAEEPAPVQQAPVQEAPAPAQAAYANCTEARNAGVAPLYFGSPGYSSKLDRDGDGVACE